MNKKIFKTLLCLGLLTSVFAVTNYAQNNTNAEERYIIGVDNDENTGADSYGRAGDNKESRFYKNPDYFNLKNDDTLVIIEKFKTMQQTTEWSCGNVTALMVLENMGIKNEFTEMAIAESMKSSTDLDTPNAKPGSADNFGEFGTDVEQMFEFFSAVKGVKVYETNYISDPKTEDLYSNKDLVPEADFGNIKRKFHNVSLYASENDPNTDKWVEDAKDSYFVKWLTGHLKENRPIMVEWVDWNGHWQAIIGYDNNGTPGIGDDTLIFADPYDTSDHMQDGYYVYPLERWFYMWHDRSIAKKPLQLQPYIVVGKE
ncbi:papain-like cysteine protease family protein [Streptobacillus felis]|uniref:papain-like cysteine protease family protein n=1 Tax=Streptobacillus felis TaxID=1384509 RepID=UPI00082C3605|nr:papain-like cysteine protease family protein [Streptobacillus felis]